MLTGILWDLDLDLNHSSCLLWLQILTIRCCHNLNYRRKFQYSNCYQTWCLIYAHALKMICQSIKQCTKQKFSHCHFQLMITLSLECAQTHESLYTWHIACLKHCLADISCAWSYGGMSHMPKIICAIENSMLMICGICDMSYAQCCTYVLQFIVHGAQNLLIMQYV